MKKCRACRRSKPLKKFLFKLDTSTGRRIPRSKCRDCHNRENRLRMRKHYARTRGAYQRADRQAHPEKYRARAALNHAIRDGKITRQPCRRCGRRADGHHMDYRQPLTVDWLCHRCHGLEHRKPAINGGHHL